MQVRSAATIVLLLLHLELLHLDTGLDHAEKVLTEVEEDHWCALDELQVDHVISVEFVDFAWPACLARFAHHTGAMSALITARFPLRLIRLFQDANIEAEELSRQKLLNDLIIV